MTTLRSAAQQALEALGLWATGRDMDAVALNDLIVRLEAALENEFNPDWDQVGALQESLREHMAEIHRLRTALAEPQIDPVDEYRKGFIAGQIDMRDRELAEPVQEPIKWTLDGDKECGYNNWLGETPFGRILITWKGWKAHPDACVDEFPGGFQAYGEPEEVKAACDAEFASRHGNAPSQRKPLTDEEIRQIALDTPIGGTNFARAIERAHGIT